MKDILENRSRLRKATKFRLVQMSIKENGLLWTAMMGAYYVASAVAEHAFKLADHRRRARSLPGMNSRAMNRLIWDSWDWSAQGEEWTPSAQWKQSVIATFLDPNVHPGAVVVEIGPGAGRWTEALLNRAGRLIGIDISASCVEECSRRFAGNPKASFLLGTGFDLAGVEAGAVDAIWSFDVFVHINRSEFHSYAREFDRVLKPGGRAVIHHGAVSGANGGWRSDVTKEDAVEILTEAGLVVDNQVSRWRDGSEEHAAGLYDDVISSVHKPPAFQ